MSQNKWEDAGTQGRNPSQDGKSFLASVVESLEDSVVSVNFDGVITSWNRGAQRLYGYSAEEAIGKAVSVLLYAEDLEPVLANIESIRRGGSTAVYETERVAGNGHRLHLSITLSPVKEDSGQTIGVSIVAHDITGRKKAEDALDESRSRFNAALAVAQLGTFEWNLRTDAVILDERSREIFGFADAEGRRAQEVFDRIDPTDFDRVYAAAQASIREKSRLEIEYRVNLPGGAVRHIVSISEVLPGTDDHAERLFGVFSDITERKREELDRQFLLELGEKIRYGGLKPEELLNEVTKTTTEHLDAARALFIEINEADNRGTIKHEFCRSGILSVAGEYKISDYSPVTLEEIKSGHVVINHDAEKDSRTAKIFKTTYEPYDERSYVSIPLFTNGKWTAIFWVSDDKPRRWTRREVTFLESVGERAWLATEKLRNEAELRESEARLRLAIDISRISTFEIDLLTDAVQTDEIGREMYGFEKDEPLTFNKVQSHFHPDDRDEVLSQVAIALAPTGSEEFEVEQRIIRTSGETRWIRVRGRALFEGTGESRHAVRCLGTYIDITRSKEAEQEGEKLLRREQAARREAEDASRLKDEFLATVSHELRTPLTAILGWSHMLTSGNFDQNYTSRALETIYRNAKSQAQLIEDILDVSRIITGKLRINARPISVSPVIQTVIESLRPSIETKNIGLRMGFDFEHRMIHADPDRLQQVLWNLLSNAIKFTPEGGQISVGLVNGETETKIVVSDTGKGIAPEFLPFVFDRFRQADGSTTRRHGGLGLGLAIVRHIVELHGGTVEVRSEGEGKGTTFTVSLPLLETPSESTKETEGHGSGANQSDSGEGPQPGYQSEIEGLRVLLVDDERDTLELLAIVLAQNGVEVNPQTNVRDALEVLKAWKPDVIVSDIAMPEEDGYSFIRKLRALPPEEGGAIPAVALTAYVGIKERTQVLSSGFQMYVPKPVEPAELLSTLASLM
jgi:PAS domain S-box-containing protein